MNARAPRSHQYLRSLDAQLARIAWPAAAGFYVQEQRKQGGTDARWWPTMFGPGMLPARRWGTFCWKWFWNVLLKFSEDLLAKTENILLPNLLKYLEKSSISYTHHSSKWPGLLRNINREDDSLKWVDYSHSNTNLNLHEKKKRRNFPLVRFYIENRWFDTSCSQTNGVRRSQRLLTSDDHVKVVRRVSGPLLSSFGLWIVP